MSCYGSNIGPWISICYMELEGKLGKWYLYCYVAALNIFIGS